MFYLVDLFWKPSTLLHNHKLCQLLGRSNSVLKFWLNLGKSIVGIHFFFYRTPWLVWSLGQSIFVLQDVCEVAAQFWNLYTCPRIYECLDSAALSEIFSLRASPPFILAPMLIGSLQSPSKCHGTNTSCCSQKSLQPRILSFLSSFLCVFLKYAAKMYYL